MTPVIITSDTPGATKIIGATAGNLLPVLDYLLVTTLGWTKPYTTGNFAVYRQPEGTNGFYLFVDDSQLAYTTFRGFVTCTGISGNTAIGTEPFPNYSQIGTTYANGSAFSNSSGIGNGVGVERSGAAGTNSYRFVSDGSIFYLHVSGYLYTSSNLSFTTVIFGDFIPLKSTDRYNTILSANRYASRATATPRAS